MLDVVLQLMHISTQKQMRFLVLKFALKFTYSFILISYKISQSDQKNLTIHHPKLLNVGIARFRIL